MSLNVLTAGDGPAMLLLHGFSGSARTWDEQVKSWSADRRCIAPDLLGHAGSDAPPDPGSYALPRQADDLAELLHLLDAVPVSVVGYSMGARLALVLALEHRDLVSSLVLESPSAGIADAASRVERTRADERLAADLEREGLEAFAQRWEAQPLFASHAALSSEQRDRLRTERLGHDPVGLAASLRGAGQGVMMPLHERLGEITAPTLVIAGALDPAGLARAGVVAEGIPGARLEIIGRAGHTPHIETPEVFLRLADGHLRQLTH